MALFDQLLGAAHDHPTVKNMSDKLGISPADAEKGIAALGEAHHEPGDTVGLAAQKTGLDAGTLEQIVEHDHDGNPFDDIAGVAGKLFGKS